MKDLRRDYNRKYYRARVKIWVNLKVRLFKLKVAAKFMRWSYKADSEYFTTVVLELARREWGLVE